ncbi:hypothetical protein [Actinokineospora inagensis]|uniref:hypothetical protein n=1 Tax=Actinokineospora inagensis TaxID=103730 RepID=UPI0012FC3425|nr:hypothetical protein [Actinokineospora inagensis]
MTGAGTGAGRFVVVVVTTTGFLVVTTGAAGTVVVVVGGGVVVLLLVVVVVVDVRVDVETVVDVDVIVERAGAAAFVPDELHPATAKPTTSNPNASNPRAVDLAMGNVSIMMHSRSCTTYACASDGRSSCYHRVKQLPSIAESKRVGHRKGDGPDTLDG